MVILPNDHTLILLDVTLVTIGHSQCHCFHLSVCCVYAASSGGSYHCPYCGKLFNTENDLKHHIDIHIGAKPYSCEHCSERFTWPGQLKTHLLKLHNEGY